MITPNTSATGGYLAPVPPPAPLEDAALDAFLQGMMTGITGMAGTLVFPRWQPEEPNYPDGDWASIGVVDQVKDTYAVFTHDPNASQGLGADGFQRHEVMEILCSFYGPNKGLNASVMADGFQVPQNREPLFLAGFGLVRTEGPIAAPALVKNKWVQRSDVRLFLRRIVERTYAVENVIEGVAELVTDVGITRQIDVTNP